MTLSPFGSENRVILAVPLGVVTVATYLVRPAIGVALGGPITISSAFGIRKRFWRKAVSLGERSNARAEERVSVKAPKAIASKKTCFKNRLRPRGIAVAMIMASRNDVQWAAEDLNCLGQIAQPCATGLDREPIISDVAMRRRE